MDTMKTTKIVGALCGSLLVFLLGGWVAQSIYIGGEGGHGEGEEHVQGYLYEVPEAGGAASAAESGPSFEELMASADAAKGEKLFNKCKACHSLEDGKNGTGPSLHGVVDRKVDSIAGFNYSGALEKVVDQWTPENMYHFLENPKGFAPGTAMGFAGLKNPEDRVNLIAYLQQHG